MFRRLILIGWFSALALCPSLAASAQIQFTPLLLSHSPVPGAPGVHIAGEFSGALSPSGHLLLRAHTNSPDINPTWAGPPGELSVFHENTPAFGLAPATLGNNYARLGPAGHIVLGAGLDQPGRTSAAVWSGQADNLHLLAMHGAEAPGLAQGITFDLPTAHYGGPDYFRYSAPDQAGDVVLVGALVGEGVTARDDAALYVGSPGQLKLIAREGDPAPGAAAGVVFAHRYFEDTPAFNIPLMGPAGHFALTAAIDGPGIGTSNTVGLWMGKTSSATLNCVFLAGQPVPGLPEYTLGDFVQLVSVNRQGKVLFSGSMAGPQGGTRGLFVGQEGSLELVAYKDQAVADQPGQFFQTIASSQLLDSGDVVFSATLSEFVSEPYAGLPSGTWRWDAESETVSALVLRGQPAPDLPGLMLDSPSAWFDAVGRMLVSSSLAGDGVNNANDRALFAGQPEHLSLILREGDTIVLDGQPRTLESFDIAHDAGSDLAGNLLIELTFTDGTSGMFLAIIPEPTCIFALMPLLLLRRRFRSSPSAGTLCPRHGCPSNCASSPVVRPGTALHCARPAESC